MYRGMTTTIKAFLIDLGWTDADLAGPVKLAAYKGDYTVSPSRYISDKADWQRVSWQLRDFFAIGATVDLQGATATVVAARTGVSLLCDGQKVYLGDALTVADVIAADCSRAN